MQRIQSTRFLPEPFWGTLSEQDLDERFAKLQPFIVHHSDEEKESPSYERLKKSFREAESKKREVEERIAFQTEYFLHCLTEQLPICIEHAILDSRSDVPDSFEGLSEGTALQFFLTMIHFFDPTNTIQEVKYLKNALEDLFALWVYQEDHRYVRADCLADAEVLFRNKIIHLLKQLGRNIPYFFFPLASYAHAMVGKVEWISEEGFRLTIVNKGDCAQFKNDETAADLIYLGLTEEEILPAILANFELPPFSADVYENIARALPSEKCVPFMGRGHGLHKRASCSIKSVAGAIHGVLPAGIYRAFKVFYTNRLIKDMEPGARLDAAHQVLLKRRLKV